jgi:hypothetical protein
VSSPERRGAAGSPDGFRSYRLRALGLRVINQTAREKEAQAGFAHVIDVFFVAARFVAETGHQECFASPVDAGVGAVGKMRYLLNAK